MEPTEQESKQNEEDWSTLTFGKTEEECKGKALLSWTSETRAALSKVKSADLDELKAMIKVPELVQKSLDAFLTVLGFRTAKERTHAMKDFKDRKLDLLKVGKTRKAADLTFNDCKTIQESLTGLDEKKILATSIVSGGLVKWVNHMVQLRIASALYPEVIKASTVITKKPAAKPSEPAVVVNRTSEEHKTKARPKTTVTKRPKIEEEKKEETKKAKKPEVPKVAKKKSVKELEDWSIFEFTGNPEDYANGGHRNLANNIQ